MSTSTQSIRTRAAAATLAGLLGVGGFAAAANATTEAPSSSTLAAQSEEVGEQEAGSGDPDRGHHGDGPRGGPGGHRGAELETAAEVLGISTEDLRQQLGEGNTTLSDVAEEQGVDPQDVIDALVAEATERIETRVTDGPKA